MNRVKKLRYVSSLSFTLRLVYRSTFDIYTLQSYSEEARPTWFVFSGMGSQWAGMAKDLFKLQVFEESMRKAADVLKAEGFDLLAVLKSEDEATFDNVLNSFVSITAIQVESRFVSKFESIFSILMLLIWISRRLPWSIYSEVSELNQTAWLATQ